MRVPFVPTLIGILAVSVIIMCALGLRIRVSLRKFGMVRGWLDDYLTDRTGMLRARRAALGVAVTNLKQDLPGNRSPAAGPRTIRDSVEREDHRA